MPTKRDFKIGDRVRITRLVHSGSTNGLCNGLIPGDVGIVVKNPEDRDWIDIGWDKRFPAGHSCNGNCKMGHGWSLYPDEIELDLPPDPATPIPEELSILYGRE